MVNEISVFEKEEFGKVQVVNRDGEIWFVAKDIAAALGYAQTNNMNKLIDDEDKYIRNIQNGGNYVNQALINESGLYTAIFGSTLPNAKAFKKWVTSEVLPSIRKTGKYSVTPVNKFGKAEKIYGDPEKYNLPFVTFTSREFGQLRATYVKKETHFFTRDVTRILGQVKNTEATVLTTCTAIDKITIHNKSTPPSSIVVLSESDVQRLVDVVDTQYSLHFMEWIRDDIVPYFKSMEVDIPAICNALIKHVAHGSLF